MDTHVDPTVVFFVVMAATAGLASTTLAVPVARPRLMGIAP